MYITCIISFIYIFMYMSFICIVYFIYLFIYLFIHISIYSCIYLFIHIAYVVCASFVDEFLGVSRRWVHPSSPRRAAGFTKKNGTC